jgi:molybdopterin-guanine dinucleotide biosynthesis protein A
VVLAGGAARRMGGAAQPSLPVAGTPLLTRVLEAAAGAAQRVVVGPPSLAPLLPPDIRLTREDPPGGGPVAGLAAGAVLVDQPLVAVLAADLPFLSPTVLSGLVGALDGAPEALALLVDDHDRPQWLCAVWRRPALTARLAALGEPAGRSVRHLVGDTPIARVRAGGRAWYDCDTPDDIRRAEEWIRDRTG